MKLNELSKLGDLIHECVQIISNDKNITNTLISATEIDVSFKDDLEMLIKTFNNITQPPTNTASTTSCSGSSGNNMLGQIGFKIGNTTVEKIKSSSHNIDPRRQILKVVDYDSSWKLHEESSLYFSPEGLVGILTNDNKIHILKPIKTRRGADRICSHKRNYSIAKCMAEVFLPNKPVNGTLAFIDGNCKNCRLDNLGYQINGIKKYNLIGKPEVILVCEYLCKNDGDICEALNQLRQEHPKERISYDQIYRIRMKKSFEEVSRDYFYIDACGFHKIENQNIPVNDPEEIDTSSLGGFMKNLNIEAATGGKFYEVSLEGFFKDKSRDDVSDNDIKGLIDFYLNKWNNNMRQVYDEITKRFPQLNIDYYDIAVLGQNDINY